MYVVIFCSIDLEAVNSFMAYTYNFCDGLSDMSFEFRLSLVIPSLANSDIALSC